LILSRWVIHHHHHHHHHQQQQQQQQHYRQYHHDHRHHLVPIPPAITDLTISFNALHHISTTTRIPLQAYLDMTSPLYAGVEAPLASTIRLLQAARGAGIPVVHTKVQYIPGGIDGGKLVVVGDDDDDEYKDADSSGCSMIP